MSNTNELHVIFGTGPLGKWTARELVKMGQRVRLVNRSGRASDVPAEVEMVRADAYEAANNIALTQGAAAVYQCAQPEYHQWPGNFPRLQAAILDAAAANNAKLIVAENLYMYGDVKGQPIREGMAYNAHTKKGKIRQEMTEAAFAAHRAGKVRVAAARGADFFGPDEPINSRLVFQPALTGRRVNLLGSLSQPHTFTYAPDFGKALAILGTHEEALGQAWHVPSAPPLTQAELVKILSEEAGHPVKAMAATPLVVRLLGLFNPAMAEMVEMMYEWTGPFTMDSSKFEHAFGMKATPFRQQIRETLDWVKANPPVNETHGHSPHLQPTTTH